MYGDDNDDYDTKDVCMAMIMMIDTKDVCMAMIMLIMTQKTCVWR